jgi:hypothetical protein
LLELTGDAEAFDNRAVVAPRRARTVRVLFAGSTTDEASAESPLFFLSRSLGPTGTLRPEITARRVESLAAADWEQADVAVIASALPEAAAALANRFVEMGGLAVILLPDAAAASWLRHAGFAVEEAKVKDYALLEGIDFEHPVFRPFATPGLRDFSKLRTWHYRRLTTPEKESIRVLARFDSGSPALVEWAVGKGRYLIWAMSWVPGDTQLPLSSKFVPMVYATLEEAGFRHEEPVRCLAGEELPGTGPETIITLPDGTQTKGRIRAEEPGLYRLQDGESEARVVACNLPPDESRLDPLPPGSLAALGVAVEAASDGESERPGPATADAERLRGGDLEGRQKLWKWLLAGLFTVLLVETWWANRSRSSPQPQPANA